MTPREELKNLIMQMNSEQFQRFIAQMRLVLSKEVDGERKAAKV